MVGCREGGGCRSGSGRELLIVWLAGRGGAVGGVKSGDRLVGMRWPVRGGRHGMPWGGFRFGVGGECWP